MATQASAGPVRAALIGATGRMGQAVVRAAPAFPRLALTAAVASATSASLGRDAGELAGVGSLGVAIGSDLPRALSEADVAIDFSAPAATRANLLACRAARKPLLLCTTGFTAALEEDFSAAARDIALLVAANTSLGVTVLVELVRTAARSLPASFDIDILEAHHRTKRDAPSGTALALAAAAREARPERRGTTTTRGVGAASTVPAGTASGGARPEGEIGFAAVRAGDIVGEHTVLFSGPGEQLFLTHRASDRAIFARGALAAALWLEQRPAGRYSMTDVVGVKTTT
jgi:4-hydroxy-tetrahydrodipicolinate reductase